MGLNAAQVSGLRDGEYLSWMNLNGFGFYVHSVKYGGKEILNGRDKNRRGNFQLDC